MHFRCLWGQQHFLNNDHVALLIKQDTVFLVLWVFLRQILTRNLYLYLQKQLPVTGFGSG